MLSFCTLTSKLKNALQSHKQFIIFRKNSLVLKFLKLLFFEGFISEIVEINSGKFLKIYLKYLPNGSPIIKKLKLLSTPGKPIYFSYTHLAKLRQGTGVFILSTPEGLLTDQSCLKNKIGGTALCFLA